MWHILKELARVLLLAEIATFLLFIIGGSGFFLLLYALLEK